MGKFKDVVEAYNFLTNHIYFAEPFKNEQDEIISFSNRFVTACDIYPIYDNGDIVWCIEYGSYSFEAKCFSYNPEKEFFTKTYEEGIIKLAEKIYKDYGEDDLNDYYKVNWDEKIFDKFGFSKIKCNWDIEAVIKKIKSYANE